DAQRLPRSRPARAGRRAGRCGVLRSASVIEPVLALPAHVRERLASALEGGLLSGSTPVAALRATLGARDIDAEAVATALAKLEALGVTGAGAGCWVRSVARASE